MKEMIKKALQKKKNQALFLLVAVALVLCIAAGAVLYHNFKAGREKPIPEIKASLEEIIERSDLNTIQYPVRQIATVMDEKGTNKKYNVSYEAMVYAGIDMKKITIEVIEPKEEKEKTRFVVKLPDAKYTDHVIDPDSYDFMFLKQKYETDTVLEEAAHACEEDLEKYLNEQQHQLSIARENAVKYMKILMQPFQESLGDAYVIEVQ